MSDASDVTLRPEVLQLIASMDEKALRTLATGKLQRGDALELRKGRRCLKDVASMLDAISERAQGDPIGFEVYSRMTELRWLGIQGAFALGERSTFTSSASAHIQDMAKQKSAARARAGKNEK